MVGYILDTDTWIEYFHHRSGIGAHIAKISPEYIYASEVSIAELTYGALHSGNVEKHMREPQGNLHPLDKEQLLLILKAHTL